MKNNQIRKLTGIALFAALIIILQLVSNYITFGPISINLSLIPVILGSLIYGPIVGFIFGLVNGGLVLAAPSTQAFFAINPVATVFVCLLKTGIAGLVCGFMPMIFKNHKKVAVILGSFLVPIINTGLFAVGSLIFFMDLFGSVEYLLLGAIGINFIVEVAVNGLLSPTIYLLFEFYNKKHPNNL